MKNNTFKAMKVNFEKHYKIIGANLKLIRKTKGLSQQELANMCDKVDRAKISDIENGKEDFMLSTLLEISVALQLNIKNFFPDNL